MRSRSQEQRPRAGSSTLSTGAIVGMPVGTAAALAFLPAGTWFLRRRQKARNTNKAFASQTSGAVGNELKYPVDANEGSIGNDGMGTPCRQSELPGEGPLYNLSQHTSEMPGIVSLLPLPPNTLRRA